MQNKQVSIIVPIYNSENYIRTCIESLLRQTYKNIEIILVNDGSEDSSLHICKEYEKKDERITVIDKKNGGPSSARNAGLKNARGDLIQFVDSDDSLEKEALEIAISSMDKKTDVLIFGFNIYSNGKLLRTPNPGDVEFTMEKSRLEEYDKIENLFISPCNKLYKKDYIKEKFNEDMKFGEDILFNYSNLCKGCKIVAIKDSLYNVTLDTVNSVNKRYVRGKLDDMVKGYEARKEKLEKIFEEEYSHINREKDDMKVILYTIRKCSENLTYKEAKEDIKKCLENPYMKYLLDKKNEEKYLNFLRLLLKCGLKDTIILGFKALGLLNGLLRR